MLCGLSSMLGRGVNENRIVTCTKIISVPVLSGCLHGGSSLIFFLIHVFDDNIPEPAQNVQF